MIGYIYICVIGVEYERSCMCVLGVEYERSCMCSRGRV